MEMNGNRYGSAVINGSGQLAGGMYEDVKISGSGVIDGNIDARDVKVSGSAKFKGNVVSRSIKVSGSASIYGKIETDDCSFSGSGDVSGELQASVLKTSGSLRCRGGIRAQEVSINGSLRSYGDVETESLDVSGSFRIDGLLNASRIDIEVGGHCSAREIGCDRMRVVTTPMSLFWKAFSWLSETLGFGKRGALTAEVIEGTELDLNLTRARIVRGNRVRIGPGCAVDLVEYTEEAFVDDDASVGEVRRLS